MMTKNGIYCPSILPDLEECFKKYCPNKTLLDIGSGSGRVLGLAFKHGASIRGVEIEKEFYNNSQFKEWVTLGDYKEMDFSIFDILFYFQKGIDDEKKLAEKINKEARGIVIIYRRGSSNEEVEELISLLNARKIDTFKYCEVLSYL